MLYIVIENILKTHEKDIDSFVCHWRNDLVRDSYYILINMYKILFSQWSFAQWHWVIVQMNVKVLHFQNHTLVQLPNLSKLSKKYVMDNLDKPSIYSMRVIKYWIVYILDNFGQFWSLLGNFILDKFGHLFYLIFL